MNQYIYFIIAILAINLLVLVHELGHFLAAKLFGVRVIRFCIGFGPRVTGIKYKGTDYCLAPIPLGGYVRLASNSEPEGSKGSMTVRPVWQQIVILFSGPLANLLFVFLAIYTIKLFNAGPVHAVEETWQKFMLMSSLVLDSFTGLITSRIPASELVGPVFLFKISAKAASIGPFMLLYLLAFISGNLFFFNLLPLPVLDGGQILLACVQKILRRQLHQRSLRLLTQASLFWVILILITATLNDIIRILT
jgi:regulator of sigma E protease